MVADVQTRRISADEFATMPDFDAPYAELIEGEIVLAGGASDSHQGKSLDLVRFLSANVQQGTLRFAPLSVRLDEINLFEPDIFWIAPDNTRCALLDERTWSGAPDLVIEILSPSTARRDRDQKYRAYESADVREYWMVEPDADFLEVYLLEDGKFHRLGVYGFGETFESPVLGIAVPVDSLFRREESVKTG